MTPGPPTSSLATSPITPISPGALQSPGIGGAPPGAAGGLPGAIGGLAGASQATQGYWGLGPNGQPSWLPGTPAPGVPYWTGTQQSGPVAPVGFGGGPAGEGGAVGAAGGAMGGGLGGGGGMGSPGPGGTSGPEGRDPGPGMAAGPKF